MPFTLAHPAIFLNDKIKQNKYLDFTTLIIGTMAPDFEYFIFFKPFQTVGHTFLGQIYLNLPLIIMLAYVYHYILKKSIISYLPKPFCYKYHHLTKTQWKINSTSRFFVVCYSALLGAFSHVIWDSFTHKNGFFVKKIELLSEYINMFDFKIPIYKILQHGSTLLGFIIIGVYLFRLQSNEKHMNTFVKIDKNSKIKYWAAVLIISIIMFLLAFLLLGNFNIGRIIITSLNSFFISILVTTLLFRLKNKYILH